MIKKNKNRVNVIFFLLLTLLFPCLLNAKSIPFDLSDLVVGSDLIAIVDVFEINSRGKSFPGSAKATIRTVIEGQYQEAEINLNWDGLSIHSLGQWLVFLKKNEAGYQATYGAQSFWKIDYAELANKECCSPFVALQALVNIKIPLPLISTSPVYINGVPEEHNPIQVKGIEVEKLVNYIEELYK